VIFVSIFSFVFAAFIFLECLFRKTDFFSPDRIYLFFQAIALGVAFLALDKAMTPFRPLTSIVLFGSAGCFVLGVWVVRLLMPIPKEARFPDFVRYHWKGHLFAAFVLATIFALGMYVASKGSGGYPLFAENKGKAIKEFFSHNFIASIALSYGGIAAFLFFMTIFKPRRRSRLLSLGLWMTVLILAYYSLAVSRSGLMFFAFAALFFYHYAVRRLSILKLVAAFLAISVIVLVTGYKKAYTYEERYGLSSEKVLDIAFKIPYLYFANNLWNLDYALNRENHEPGHPHTFGFVTVSGILDFIPVPGGFMGAQIREAGGYDDQFHVTSVKVKGLNTISYQWSLYKDFGLIGTLVGPFLYGLLLGFLYLTMLRKPTLLNVAIYSYQAFFTALNMFGYFLEIPIYVYGLFYVCGTIWLCQKLAPAPDLKSDIPVRT
jgi:oligosaccharide repeat unit polymerase